MEILHNKFTVINKTENHLWGWILLFITAADFTSLNDGVYQRFGFIFLQNVTHLHVHLYFPFKKSIYLDKVWSLQFPCFLILRNFQLLERSPGSRGGVCLHRQGKWQMTLVSLCLNQQPKSHSLINPISPPNDMWNTVAVSRMQELGLAGSAAPLEFEAVWLTVVAP